VIERMHAFGMFQHGLQHVNIQHSYVINDGVNNTKSRPFN